MEQGAVEAIRGARALGLRLAICSNTGVRSGEDYRRDLAPFGLAECFDAYVAHHFGVSREEVLRRLFG